MDIGETNVVITISALESKRLSRRRVNVICRRIVPERGKDQEGSYQTPTFVRVLSVNSSRLRLTGPKTPSEITAQTLVLRYEHLQQCCDAETRDAELKRLIDAARSFEVK